jgi:hypothetical protein
MKQRLPIAAAFWLPPLIAPMIVCLIFAKHLLDADITLFFGIAIMTLSYTYIATLLVGVPGFRYFRSKSNFPWPIAAIFGFTAGVAAVFPFLICVIAWTGWHNNDTEPLLEMFFTQGSLLTFLTGGVIGTAVSLLSWQMMKAYPPLHKFL